MINLKQSLPKKIRRKRSILVSDIIIITKYFNVNIAEDVDKLRAQITESNRYIARLIKEKSQLQQPQKEKFSVGVQFDYLIPSLGKKRKCS